MPPFRNLLNRKNQPNGADAGGFDENHLSPHPRPGPIPSRRSCDGEPNEYKLSVVNDSGVYLPPSPPEKQSFWHRYPGSSRSSNNHRDLVDENEPFSISRESFDSYRRSFDISARSPIHHPDAAPSRTSLDSRFCRINSLANRSTSFEKPPSMEEETFEEVGLNDEVKPKKKGLFARFGDNSGDAQHSGSKSSTSFGFHIPGRKRGQSGGGSELGAMKTVKRRVESAENGNGKRSKSSAAKKSQPAALVKKSSSKKDVKPSKGDKKKAPKKKIQEESEDDDEDDFDIDDVSDSGDDLDVIDEPPEDVEMDDVEEDDSEEEEKSDGDWDDPSESNDSSDQQTLSLGNASRESHAKQKVLQQERKAAKPNAAMIERSKKLWEQLRRKSHVPLEQRKKLIKELFEIIIGRVRDFVFKHDSVRVIQTALKYGNLEQRKQIAQELKGNYRELAQSRYGKFLVGKLIVHGDTETRDMIIPEFYGHVKRLIRHPEGSWILDDIYRTVATKEQKTRLLREWYGPEFVLFQDEKEVTADLPTILAAHPEKRSSIMHFLHELINQLVQKKSTGFTMLHDAMLQYFLSTKPGSTEANEFLELLKGDEEGDLVKNLAFTQSGSRLMCLAFAYASAKDRKLLLRFYRDTVKVMAGDLYGHMVLLSAYEVIDDTKLSSKSIFSELLNQNDTEEARDNELLYQVTDLTARIPVLYPFTGDRVKWLLPPLDREILAEVREIRKETSKKDPAVRQQELAKAASPTLLAFIAARAEALLESSFGCQLICEVLFSADGDKTAALMAVAQAAKTDSESRDSAALGRALKSLVQGGPFNPAKRTVEKVQPLLNFHGLLYEQIRDDIMKWATGPNVFVIVALAESDDFEQKNELLKTLKKNKKALEQASASGKDGDKLGPTASGAKLLLEKL
ncbi:hypothetical protein N7532_005874 [Penicillium argentinense]|uniref:PUM-HD domain-containing protein n=1 Tax=Penicillium argentinense TaxID=1131581 RepID=A0A9W9FEP9_9EURO|nr:uncharacterized protein N7532_005874 [Penicillium argentinense]KAJ5098873.1 hypothetical protein N7532_005874 [Penicillium argentinense]